MSSRARRQKVRTFYPGGAHLKTKWCALLSFELVKVVLRLGRCHSISSFGFVLLNQDKYLVSKGQCIKHPLFNFNLDSDFQLRFNTRGGPTLEKSDRGRSCCAKIMGWKPNRKILQFAIEMKKEYNFAKMFARS